MRLYSMRSIFVILVVMVAIAGWAGGGRVQSAEPTSGGGGSIAIKASSFSFSPNEIRVAKPGLLAIEIKNVSGSVHNFTLNDVRGTRLKGVDIQPGGSAMVEVELREPGVYKFYCNKTMHAAFGMSGLITVGR